MAGRTLDFTAADMQRSQAKCIHHQLIVTASNRDAKILCSTV